ncbi:hypothetical protein [Anaplasma phagocytophilum]|uniref:hypothetical protein n=1 Tax=Anaplasma phagocytophilum TaxID=948 RepID=UPI0009C038AF
MDRAAVLYFPKPGSFTEKEVVELHAHGGSAVMHPLYHGNYVDIAILSIGRRRKLVIK